MATKLKNTLLKKRTKAIAFLLAMLLFAGSGYFASMIAKSFYAYNSFGTDNFTQSVIFRHSFNNFQYIFGYGAEAMSCTSLEDYKKTSEGKDMGMEIGLGLYIVKDIMRQHNGSCGAINHKSGVEFYIRLPKDVSE